MEIVGILVTRGVASYRDLDEYLSCEDAMRMLEMLRVKDYNEWQFADLERQRMKDNG